MNLSHLRKLDWMLVGCAVIITVFGLVAIFSTGMAKGDYGNFYKQLLFFGMGLVLMLALSFFDYRILKHNSYLILALYFISFLLLVGTLFFAPNIRGARGWYRLGPISLDPLEPAKIILIFLLAKYFSMRHVQMYRFRHIVLSGFYAGLMAVPVFLRPDLGGAAVLVLIWLGILVVSGIKLRHFIILSLCFFLVAGAGWFFVLKDYQKSRVTAFLFPTDVLGTSWSQTQTKISIGAGQWFGQGVGGDSQVQYGFLPEPHTDFIFSVIAEQWGLIGVSAFFIVYGLLVWRVLKIAITSSSNFPRLFAVGFAIILVAQFIINIGMNVALLPVVGLYLPFVSYGGSGLLGNFIMLGILQSIKAER